MLEVKIAELRSFEEGKSVFSHVVKPVIHNEETFRLMGGKLMGQEERKLREEAPA